MAYMKERLPLYTEPDRLMEGTRSILITGTAYRRSHWVSSASGDEVLVSSYAWGRDYHRVLKKRITRVLEELKPGYGDFQYRIFVDTAPVLERDLALMGGLGWIGKNTCLIHPEYGSYLFLAGALLSLDLSFPASIVENQCGNCTRCIRACPTGALQKPYSIDARRCISYLTIEHRSPDPGATRARCGWLFGCDICQEVCPHNQSTRLSEDPAWDYRPSPPLTRLSQLENLDREAFRQWVMGTCRGRMTFDMFVRNLSLLKKSR